MERSVVQPADVSGDALNELKNWLGISRSGEDDLLENLLLTALDACENYVGQAPLAQSVEERLATNRAVHRLRSRPVLNIEFAETVEQDGTHTQLAEEDYRWTVLACRTATFELLNDQDAQAIAVRFRVGMAETWSALPASIRQGVVQMAALTYRSRDRNDENSRKAPVPADVVALWRPSRSFRLQ